MSDVFMSESNMFVVWKALVYICYKTSTIYKETLNNISGKATLSIGNKSQVVDRDKSSKNNLKKRRWVTISTENRDNLGL